MDSGGGGGGARAEAERWLTIAERLLTARDLVGCKRFAERALECDPLLNQATADRILAAADVLLAAQPHLRPSPYSILQLDPSATPAAIARSFRRLALLLRSSDADAQSPAAASAFILVSDAYAVLSDPSKKAAIDSELRAGNPAPPTATFWTACSSCCHVHEYAREYINRTLRCPDCKKAFQATEMATPPPVVPGTNMYYCSWGFYPVGIPSAADIANGWKPFVPMFPPPGADGNGQSKADIFGEKHRKEPEPEPEREFEPAKNKKKVARKRVGNNMKKRVIGESSHEPPSLGPDAWSGTQMKNSGININEEVRGGAGVGALHIDLDADAVANDDILGNLHNLPFLRDEDIQLKFH